VSSTSFSYDYPVISSERKSLSRERFLAYTDEIFLDSNIFGASIQKSLSSFVPISDG